MTQECLAELVDINLRQLARIESGESFATAETIERLSEKLNVLVQFLFNIKKPVDEETNKTLYAMDIYRNNFDKMRKKITKIADNSKKTEFVCLAIDALDKKTMLEKLKCTIWGMELQ